ncbi:MAG TPA: chemotaxis protein CheB, partial [Opitutaceae bacterium]
METREDELDNKARVPDSAEQDEAERIDDAIPTWTYRTCPLVALGGSTGAIPALQTFFSKIPERTGIAFVIILHLSSEHESSLAEILQRSAQIPVEQLKDGTKLLPDHAYVIPPGKHVSMVEGIARLQPVRREPGRRIVVDHFFRTLADTHGPHAIAVVLSGADSDGSIGIKRVKERGGLTIAQDPREAENDGMPRAAIGTSMIDWVLRADEIPTRILDYLNQENHLALPGDKEPENKDNLPSPEQAYQNILGFLRDRTGRDFSLYKRATILRRIARRM